MTPEHEEAVRLAKKHGARVALSPEPFPNAIVFGGPHELAALIAEVEQRVARECVELCEAVEDDGGEWDIQSQCANSIKDRFLTGEEGK